jgi:hypothetical protein
MTASYIEVDLLSENKMNLYPKLQCSLALITKNQLLYNQLNATHCSGGFD